jgi:hypothetical protein
VVDGAFMGSVGVAGENGRMNQRYIPGHLSVSQVKVYEATRNPFHPTHHHYLPHRVSRSKRNESNKIKKGFKIYKSQWLLLASKTSTSSR